MDRSYTILLDRGGRQPSRPFRGKFAFDQGFEAPSAMSVEPPRPAIHREKLTAQELQELTQEPEFVAAAEIMHTRLLSPVADGAVEKGLALVAENGRRQSWGIAAVGADRSKFTGADVSVAMLDTGIDAEHPAFRDVDLIEKDFTGAGNGDANGHGTHCAGILFGRNVDGVRIGVAPGVRRALIGKVIDRDGGDSDMLIRGLLWAHEQRAQVISMSVGFDVAATVADRLDRGWGAAGATAVTFEAYQANLRLLDLLLQMLRMHEPYTGGAVVVAAAGNDSSRGAGGDYIMAASPTSSSDNVVSVGSLDQDSLKRGYRVSSFSNSGVKITAPGSGIPSAAAGGGLKALSGTSVAAPHVAGVAALWWQAVRQSDLPASATLIRAKLLGEAKSKGFSQSVWPSERGAGRAFAPQEGLASVTARWTEHDGRSAQVGDDLGWSAGGIQKLASGFEPISLDVARARRAVPGGSRSLC